MAIDQRPAVSRRQLRFLLRTLRAEANETQKQAADALDWSTAKLMRFEVGKMRPTISDLRALLSHYRIIDEERIKQFEEIARNARRPTLAGKYGDALSEKFREFLEDEEAARTILHYEPVLIPGPLQTEEYARVALNNYVVEEAKESIELRVKARLERKELLKQGTGPEATFIVDEAAIRRRVGTPDQVIRQLQHLKELSELPNVSIHVVPFGAGIYQALGTPFVILEFDDLNDANLLYLEDRDSQIIVRDEGPELEMYAEIFTEMEKIATRADAFAGIIDRLIEEPVLDLAG